MPDGHQLSETVPAVAGSVPRVRQAIARFAVAAGASAAIVDDVRLSVSEAVTNAVLHAYKDRDEPGPVHVTADVDGEQLFVEVSDEGGGIVPRLDSPGMGLGLPLIAQSAHTMDVHLLETGGTAIRMTFRLAG